MAEGGGRAPRLTARGSGTLASGVAFAVLGLVLHWPAYLAVGGWATGSLGLALLAIALPVRVDATVGAVPTGLARGATVTIPVRVVNRGRGRSRPCLVVLRTGQEAAVPALPRAGRHDAGILLRDVARGEHRLGPVRVVRTDPLRLVRRVVGVGGDATLLVWPVLVELPGRPAVTSRYEGAQSGRLFDGSVEFDGLRQYVVGDDLRRVHWPSSRRVGTLLIRTFVDVARPACTVVLDGDPAAYADAEDRERAVDAAASVGLAALAGRQALRLWAGGPPAPSGDGDRRAVLDRLGRWQLDAGHSLAAVAPRVRRGGDLVVVTGSSDTGQDGVAGALERVLLFRAGGDLAAAWARPHGRVGGSQ